MVIATDNGERHDSGPESGGGAGRDSGERNLTSAALLEQLGYPRREANDLPSSPKRFPDGASYRVEMPSVEGPLALEATFSEADARGVTVHRVSSGTGILLATDGEIRDMVAMCAERGTELSLFVGPRASWDIGAQSITPHGAVQGLRHEGANQLLYAMEDLDARTPSACAARSSPTRGYFC